MEEDRARGRENFNFEWNQCQLCWGGLKTFSHSSLIVRGLLFEFARRWCARKHPRRHGKMCTMQDVSFFLHLRSLCLPSLTPPIISALSLIHRSIQCKPCVSPFAPISFCWIWYSCVFTLFKYFFPSVWSLLLLPSSSSPPLPPRCCHHLHQYHHRTLIRRIQVGLYEMEN